MSIQTHTKTHGTFGASEHSGGGDVILGLNTPTTVSFEDKDSATIEAYVDISFTESSVRKTR